MVKGGNWKTGNKKLDNEKRKLHEKRQHEVSIGKKATRKWATVISATGKRTTGKIGSGDRLDIGTRQLIGVVNANSLHVRVTGPNYGNSLDWKPSTITDTFWPIKHRPRTYKKNIKTVHCVGMHPPILTIQVYLRTPMDRATLLHVNSTILHCPSSIITRQWASVDSKLLGRQRNVGYYPLRNHYRGVFLVMITIVT